MIIKRDIFENLKKNLNRKEIIALVGSRQVGKTTLMRELEKDIKGESTFLTFENLDDLRLFEEDINYFIKKYVENKKYLFIDEFQYAKNGGQKLKFIYDTKDIKIIISGSSQPELAIHSLQYLVGRVFIYEIFPLTFKEYLNYNSIQDNFLLNEISSQERFSYIKNYFEDYLIFGGYPKVILEKTKEDKIAVLSNLVNSYLLKEIKDILEYKNIYEYENMLKKLAMQDGSILNKNSISQDLGIHNNKVAEMINILEKTYILGVTRPFLKNKSKELIKSPKTYIQDLGFKNSLIKNFNEINLKTDKGEIYENFIYNAALKNDIKLNFWNLQNRNEIDFVYEYNGQTYGFEVKSKLKDDKLTNSMKKFIEMFNPKVLYIFNENIDSEYEFEKTRIIFTNYLNIFYIIDNEVKK